MMVRILVFGVAKDIVGGTMATIDIDGNVADVRMMLEKKYPALKQLSSYAIAVNGEYAGEGLIVKEGDEIAIIPPVSGG